MGFGRTRLRSAWKCRATRPDPTPFESGERVGYDRVVLDQAGPKLYPVTEPRAEPEPEPKPEPLPTNHDAASWSGPVGALSSLAGSGSGSGSGSGLGCARDLLMLTGYSTGQLTVGASSWSSIPSGCHWFS